ncbi:hypothetical protein AGMMS49992_32510 [Clostridia bacterium]|nr:hypothetical protein AGMMS49992_32510 [Clostridia bacterium]
MVKEKAIMHARVVRQNNVLKIEINGEVIEPVSFRSFWPSAEAVRAFAQSGTRLMTVFPSGILCGLRVPYSQFGEVWTGEGQYDWGALRRQMDLFRQNAPDAYLSLMLMLDTRDWYLRDHPEASDSFAHIARMAGDQVWRESAARMIRDMLDWLQREYPETIYAVYICAGGTCEWYNSAEQTEQISEKARRYQAGTGKPTPSDEALNHTTHGVLRDPIEDKDALDYWRHHNEVIADAIEYFAAVVKQHTQRSLLVGCFFGYVSVESQLYQFGHLAASRIFACPDVDMVFAPASYTARGLEASSASQLPIDSAVINEKLYFHEIDNTAFPANGNPYAQVLQAYAHRRHDSLRESIHYSRREAALTMSKGGAHWWFDMFGGWYDHPKIMAALQGIREANARLNAQPVHSVSQVALLVDLESNYYIGKQVPLHGDWVIRQRAAVGLMGCPVDEYFTTDILSPRFPREQYKLYILPDLYAPSDALRDAVASLRASGANLLFGYASGAITASAFDLDGIQDLMGIRIACSALPAGYTVVDAGLLNDDGMPRVYGRPYAQTLSLACDDPEAAVYGRDLVNREARLVVKRRTDGGFSAWSMQGPLPSFVLRPMARMADVHIYQYDNLPVYANNRMLALFSHKGGEHRLRLPFAVRGITEMYTGETHLFDPDGISLQFDRDECKCFLYDV